MMNNDGMLDEITDNWLRENDPYYSCTKKNKKKTSDYPYETTYQEKYRRRHEKVFSSLGKTTLDKLRTKNIDVTSYMEG